MRFTYHPSSPIDLMTEQQLQAAEKSLPATGAQALRAKLEGLLEQERRGENVGKRILEVCEELQC